MNRVTAPQTIEQSAQDQDRRDLALPGRIVWRDARGTVRFATIRTRRVSEEWATVECLGGIPIPLYRLVHLQIDDPALRNGDVPASLRRGKVLSAVYRVGASRASTGLPEDYDLRLLVDPAAKPLPSRVDDARSLAVKVVA